MKKRRRITDRVNHDRWLVSYADFITLMFAFFVVMFASARMDQKKAARLSLAIESAFQQLGAFEVIKRGAIKGGGRQLTSLAETIGDDAALNLTRTSNPAPGMAELNHKPEDLEAIRAELEKALAPEIMRREVALRVRPDGLVVSLREIGFFDSGSATIKPEAEDAFGRVTHVLGQHGCALRIEGHTDTVPIHTARFSSNWELSTARATEVVKVLVERYSFAADRLSAAGYAQFRPVADNSEPQGRQLNRRVDIVILEAAVPRALYGKDGVMKPTGNTVDGRPVPTATPNPLPRRVAGVPGDATIADQ